MKSPGAIAGLLALSVPAGAVERAPAAGALLSEPAAGGYAQVLLGLLLVLGLILAAAWLLRRLGRFPVGTSGALRVLGGLSLGQRERLVLVQVGEQQLLLGVTAERIQTLHVLAEPLTNPAHEARGDAESFAARLRAALKRGGQA